MLIIPAIDLLSGNVVRLTKGDPKQSKIYSHDPVEVANHFKVQGAELLHVVDLSAAFGDVDNAAHIKDIITKAKVRVEVGGGIRTLKRARELLALGVERIIVGTRALDESFLKSLLAEFGPEKIVVGVDSKASFVATHGWQKTSLLRDIDFIKVLQSEGVRWIIHTDISRDGMLSGPNIEAFKQFRQLTGMCFIFSGGVTNLDDLHAIKQELPFVCGVIVGKALYEGTLDFSDALKVVS
ncbi:MAG: 1-(5-phosphoribosyl)-5-[(5-phosphoribosylamino)methylideneamino]imidazole-4-carboxamide isomerase [Candidatus Omnitrophota bacterium]|nr:1-(5-phosphoribosyl)-5-[(5-phosphoribosylamino)methylideneamino]imidazole-4-carboxamide isomerase [Candidatus Omnitrophota bacterium]